MSLASFRHIMGNTKRFKFLLTNDKFQLIPSLSTYNNSLETLRSSQLMQVPACFVFIQEDLAKCKKFQVTILLVFSKIPSANTQSFLHTHTIFSMGTMQSHGSFFNLDFIECISVSRFVVM